MSWQGSAMSPFRFLLRLLLTKCDDCCRDEFSLDFRTEQYREQLKMEDKYAKRALDLMRTQHAGGNQPEEQAHGTKDSHFGCAEGLDKPFLYDLVFEKHDASHTGASKVHRCGLHSSGMMQGL
jgi:hypothetical protein